MPAAFEITNLVVRYDRTTAVDGITASAQPGTITALLGPNGAGKSSVLSVLSTITAPASGTARIFGHDTTAEPVDARRRIGLVFQERTLDADLTVEQNLRFHARLFRVRRAEAKAEIPRLLERFGLTGREADRVEKLSGGLARRLEIARALLHRPGLLILDEPTNGLDPDVRRAVWDDLTRLRADLGVTVLYSTHYMDEAELADQIVILRSGKVAGIGTPTSLKERLESSHIVVVTGDDDAAADRLSAAGYAATVEAHGVMVHCREPERHVAAVVRAAGPEIQAVTVRHPSMNDVFLAATVSAEGMSAADDGVRF